MIPLGPQLHGCVGRRSDVGAECAELVEHFLVLEDHHLAEALVADARTGAGARC